MAVYCLRAEGGNTFSGEGGADIKRSEDGMLILEGISSLIGDDMNLEGVVFFSDEGIRIVA